MKQYSILSAIAVIAGLSGCDTFEEAYVGTFTQPQPPPSKTPTDYRFARPAEILTSNPELSEGGLEVGNFDVSIEKANVFTNSPYPGIPITFDMTFRNNEKFTVAVALQSLLFDASDLSNPSVESTYTQKLDLSKNQVVRDLNVVGPRPKSIGPKLVVFDILARDTNGDVVVLDRFQLEGIEIVADPGV
ncbi:hypothetical protein [Sedimentitalea nanhaiensis]|uniref:Uncharacterized protein n=1 Tax=Sedimentitalea nanhaiensis TaxID=999627 RepID=A0A1I7DCF4_9RHOB|nr:hypothetical protein [Sedimentitalea nanhaiensis]SFU09327.1 hypothetical protein SAMN05216236_1263 [Sedimentitalea nanhaiensis]